jgi:(1->4)-alpha-D-glucan 1-alpha-D-glucosylmutase
VIAYLRGDDVVTVVPRLVSLLAAEWEQTAVKLPEGRWTNRLTGASVEGGKVAVGDLLRDFPVALLVKE